jgi:hypothetical protein
MTIAIVAPTVRARDVGGQIAAMRVPAAGVISDAQVNLHVEETKRAFVTAAKTDLDRIMIAKGMRTMGPFDTFDELTFSQKKQADYALVPEIELRVAWPLLEPHGPYFTEKGDLAVDGEFLLVISEPLSGQKIWSKRLAIPKRSAPFQGGRVKRCVNDVRRRDASESGPPQ